jgi:hypothetical protein
MELFKNWKPLRLSIAILLIVPALVDAKPKEEIKLVNILLDHVENIGQFTAKNGDIVVRFMATGSGIIDCQGHQNCVANKLHESKVEIEHTLSFATRIKAGSYVRIRGKTTGTLTPTVTGKAISYEGSVFGSAPCAGNACTIALTAKTNLSNGGKFRLELNGMMRPAPVTGLLQLIGVSGSAKLGVHCGVHGLGCGG